MRLEAYICPAGVLSIGYGSTGPEVYRGLVITEEKAEQMLTQDLQRFEHAVRDMIGVPLTQHEFDAIVSFTYNVGEGALSSSTFRRRMNAGDDKATCFKEEFPRWTSGGMPGLVRRRDAEVELATN